MNIPNDPMMLLSDINTQLRDHYASLDALCLDMELSSQTILDKLATIDYHYDKELNRFL